MVNPLAVRLSKADLESLKAEATRLGVTRSELIRDRIHGVRTKPQTIHPQGPVHFGPALTSPTPAPIGGRVRKRIRPAAPIPRWCAAIAPRVPPPLGCVPADVVAWFGQLYAVSSVAEAQRLVAESGEGLAVYSIVIGSQIDHDGHAHPVVTIAPVVEPLGGTSQDYDLIDPETTPAPKQKPRRAPGQLKKSGHSPEACQRAFELSRQVGGETGISWAAIGRLLAAEGHLSRNGHVIKGRIARSMSDHHRVLVLGHDRDR